MELFFFSFWILPENQTLVVDPCLLPSSQVQKQCCLIFQWQRLNNSIIANILFETFSHSSLNLVSHQWFNGRVVLYPNTKSPVRVTIHFFASQERQKKFLVAPPVTGMRKKPTAGSDFEGLGQPTDGFSSSPRCRCYSSSFPSFPLLSAANNKK